MSRKDYIAMAAAISSQRMIPPMNVHGMSEQERDVYTAGWEGARCAVAAVLAVVLSSDNPRFDYGRFYSAARVTR